MTTTVPSSTISTQCLPLGTAEGSDSGSGGTFDVFPTSFKVDAGAMILGCSSIEPCKGDWGANGTAHQTSETASKA
jgi:hypothetical protein